MFKLYLILLIGYFEVSYVLSGKDDAPLEQQELDVDVSSSESSNADNILPLIVINSNDSCIKPTKIQSYAEGEYFTGETKFSAESEGQQMFLCAIEENESKAISGQARCTYPMKFEDSEPLRCTHQPKPIISLYTLRTEMTTLNEVSCGPNKNGKIYRYVYKICMTDKPNPKEKQKLFNSFVWNIAPIIYQTEIEIYRVCHVKNEGVIYTEHKISSSALLKDEKLQQERQKTYKVIYDPTNPFGFRVDSMKFDYNRYAQNPDAKKLSYTQQTLVPPDDMAFALWRKATYDVFNSKRMRTDFILLWDHINRLIRENAIQNDIEYYIHTSSFKLEYTRAQDHNLITPIPNVWMKKIYYYSGKPLGLYNVGYVQAVAILMDGNFDTGNLEAEQKLHSKCQKNICQDAFTKTFPIVGKSVRCCSMVDNLELQEDGVKVDADLEIDFLFDDLPKRKKREDLPKHDVKKSKINDLDLNLEATSDSMVTDDHPPGFI